MRPVELIIVVPARASESVTVSSCESLKLFVRIDAPGCADRSCSSKRFIGWRIRLLIDMIIVMCLIWLKCDRQKIYPTEFVTKLTEKGYLSALILEKYGGLVKHKSSVLGCGKYVSLPIQCNSTSFPR